MTNASSETDDVIVRPGQVLEGKFRVERILGKGAMGLVVEATHLVLDERVALKFLFQKGTDEQLRRAFTREARAAVRLKSAHVARVYDVGNTEDGTPFIVMEYLEGSDLASLLELNGKLSVAEATECIIEACEGLAEAHASGMVHRDVKPENLFMTQRAGTLKQVKLLDFGISTLLTNNLEEAPTKVAGSPRYMSPEVVSRADRVDGRADVWSLGVVLFELIAGITPFDSPDLKTLLAKIKSEPHPVLSELAPGTPKALDAIVDRCLAKDPERRYPTAAAVALALLPFAPKRARAAAERAAELAGIAVTDDEPAHVPAPAAAPPAPAVAAAHTASPVTTSKPPTKRSPVPIVAAAVVVVLGIGIAAWAFLQPHGAKPAAQTQTPAAWATVQADSTGSAARPAIPIDPTPPPPAPETAPGPAPSQAVRVPKPAPHPSPAATPRATSPSSRPPIEDISTAR